MRLLAAGIVLGLLSLAAPSTSWAESDGLAAAAADYARIAPNLAAQSQGVSSASDVESVMTGSASGTSVDAPIDPANPVQVDNNHGEDVGLEPPQLDDLGDGKKLGAGVVGYFSPQKDAAVLVQLTSTGLVRLLVVAQSSAAPSDYPFAVTSEAGSVVSVTGDGGLEVDTSDGDETARVSPPWALDAVGHSLPTWFTTSGNEAILHVDAGDAAYPYVADPEVLVPDPDEPGSIWDNDTSSADYAQPAPPSQCGMPLSSRTGGWACAGATPTTPAPDPPAMFGNAQQQYCRDDNPNLYACWYTYGTGVSSAFQGGGIFGYGDSQLGSFSGGFRVELNGGQSISKPVDVSIYLNGEPYGTAAGKDILGEAERLYYSKAHPEGHPVSKGKTYSVYGPVDYIGDGNTFLLFKPNGYKAFENTVQHGSVVHEYAWTVQDYPGTWYFFGQSVKFDMTPNGYRVGSPSYIGKNPFGDGYHAH